MNKTAIRWMILMLAWAIALVVGFRRRGASDGSSIELDELRRMRLDAGHVRARCAAIGGGAAVMFGPEPTNLGEIREYSEERITAFADALIRQTRRDDAWLPEGTL